MPESRPKWALIVHGGAKNIPEHARDRHRRGCLEAVKAGAAVLEAGGAAVQAVEAAVRTLEDDPSFNAGYGSVLNAAGEVECDAAIMDGASLAVGGVAAVRTLRHPISVARAMLPEAPVLLVGQGAEAFARDKGAEFCTPAELAEATGQTIGCDTVGCVALDRDGNLAAGTSTGGLAGSAVGRVGDSPIPGCGLYADNAVGAVSLSGEGESLIRTTLASRLIRELERVDPDQAIRQTLRHLERVGGDAGLIVIDRQGRIGWGHNSAQFAVAHGASDCSPRAFVARTEDEGDET